MEKVSLIKKIPKVLTMYLDFFTSEIPNLLQIISLFFVIGFFMNKDNLANTVASGAVSVMALLFLYIFMRSVFSLLNTIFVWFVIGFVKSAAIIMFAEKLENKINSELLLKKTTIEDRKEIVENITKNLK